MSNHDEARARLADAARYLCRKRTDQAHLAARFERIGAELIAAAQLSPEDPDAGAVDEVLDRVLTRTLVAIADRRLEPPA